MGLFSPRPPSFADVIPSSLPATEASWQAVYRASLLTARAVGPPELLLWLQNPAGAAPSVCYHHSETMSGPKQCIVLRRGLTEYAEGWELQRRTVAAVAEGRSPPVLILLQHPPTYTLGVRGKDDNLLVSEEALARLGARVYRVDRGGDVTFHGPGQIVGYPIFRLDAWRKGPLWYVRHLEAAIIDALAALGVAAGRVDGRPGVWVGAAKVAAIGVRVSRGTTSHGFALNVSPDLSYFAHIVPCGLADAAVTSVERLVGRPVPLPHVEDLLVDSLGRAFALEMLGATEETPVAAGGV